MAGRPPIPERVGALDGLRGWAALGVLTYHLTWELFGYLYPIYRSLPSIFLNGAGALAVCVFFATSGYLLTIRRWHVVDDKRLLVQLFKRYVRLTVPILGSVILFWAVIQLGLVYSNQANKIVHRDDWLGIFGDARPNLWDAITFGLYRNYVGARVQNFGPFLWTMAIQLWGSFMVMPIAWGARVFREQYSPLIFIVAVFMVLFPPAGCVALGALMALAQRDGLFFTKPATRLESVIATVTFFLAMAIATYVHDWKHNGQVIQSILSLVILASAIRSRPLTTFFTNPVSVFMGKISFPIYLTQCAILISFTSWLIIQVNAANALNVWTAGGIAAISVVVTLFVSWTFLPVESFATWLVKQIDHLFPKRVRPTAPPVAAE